MAYTNNNGQTRIGVRSGVLVAQTPSASTLWNSIYAIYNGDSVGSQSLKTSLYAVYNGESNANDSFGSNNGTAVGGLTYTTGKIGNAFNFNGTNAYVSLPDNSLNLTGDFTISAWVYHIASGGQMIASNYAFTSNTINKGWELGIDIISGTQNRVGFLIAQGPSNTAYTGWEFTTTGLTQNAWNHIVIKRVSGVDTYCWINGVSQSYTLKGTGANITLDPTYHTTNKANIGSLMTLAGVASTFMKNGTKIDSLNVWNKALSTPEITELYNSGNGAQYITNDFYKPTTNDALNTYNGTAQGGLTYGVGKVGTAFQFNGTNSFINLPTSSHQLTTFSINFWIFNPAAQTTTIAANFGNDGQNKGWYLGLITTNGHGIRFVAFNNNVNILALNATATATGGYTNRWSMATLTVNGTSVKMYLDGGLVSSGTMSNTINYTTTTYPLIGGYRVNNGGVSGILANNTRLDAFNIWDKELSASEITELYNSGNGKQYPN